MYAREHGPQCLEAPIVSQEESAEQIVRQLLNCPLTWYWESEREEGRFPLPGQPELPRVRPVTLLTERNSRDLAFDIDEFIEEEPDGLFRNLVLFGVKCEITAPLQDNLDAAMQRFLLDLDPVETVLVRMQDSATEYLFFRHQVTLGVRCLWDAWGLDPNNVSKTLPYKRLRAAQLENAFPARKI